MNIERRFFFLFTLVRALYDVEYMCERGDNVKED